MQDETIGIIALASLSIITSLIFHIFYKKYVNTSIASGVVAITIFLIISHIAKGPEKFVLVAFFVGGIFSILISLIVGGVIYFIKKYIQTRI